MTAKQTAFEILEALPDDCSLKEIRSRLHLEILLSEADRCEERGEEFSQDEVEQIALSWRK